MAARCGHGGCARRDIAGVRRVGTTGWPTAPRFSAESRADRGVAHRGRGVVGIVAQRDVGGEVERRVAAAFVEEDAARVPRRLVFTGRAANLS